MITDGSQKINPCSKESLIFYGETVEHTDAVYQDRGRLHMVTCCRKDLEGSHEVTWLTSWP